MRFLLRLCQALVTVYPLRYTLSSGYYTPAQRTWTLICPWYIVQLLHACPTNMNYRWYLWVYFDVCMWKYFKCEGMVNDEFDRSLWYDEMQADGCPKGEVSGCESILWQHWLEGMESAGTLAPVFACFVNAVSFENKEVHTRGQANFIRHGSARISGSTAMANRLEQSRMTNKKLHILQEKLKQNSVDGVLSL